MLAQIKGIRRSKAVMPGRVSAGCNSRGVDSWCKLILTLGVAAAVMPQALHAQVPQDGQAVASGLTVPYGGVWIPGNAPGNTAGGHWWQPDGVLGVCRIDPAGAGANPPFRTSTVANACSTVAKGGGQALVATPAPGFQGLPAGAKFLFVADASSKSNQVVRFVINPATETIVSSLPMNVVPPSAVGGGSNGARAVALALAPNGVDLYVGYIKSGDIMKITNATGTTSGSPTVAKVGTTSDGKGVNSMVMFTSTNPNATPDLYLAELGGFGLSVIPDPSGTRRAACASTAPCTAKTPSGLPNGVPANPAGLAADSTSLYIGDSPLNGTPGMGIVKWTVGTSTTSIYTNNINPSYSGSDGIRVNSYSQLANPVGLAFDPNGNLLVSDDPSFRCAAPACPAPPTSQGHLWTVSATAAAPTVTGLSPSSGVPAGGTSVTISGTGFSTAAGATTVAFGSASPVTASCTSNKSCTVASPAGTAVVDVVVTVGAQSSAITPADQFTYQPVTVTGISPNSGPVSGATAVVITGAGFGTDISKVKVNFGNSGAASVSPTSCSATSCNAVSPAGVAGSVDVTVSVITVNGSGQIITTTTSNVSPADVFNYVASSSPIITGLCVFADPGNLAGTCTPNTAGLSAGGTAVKITGGNLSGSQVNFGANAASNVVCSGGTSCTLITPPSPIGAGNVGVTLSVAGQTSQPFNFTYATPSATVFAFGITAPKGGMLWIPGALGGHWWSSDHANGFCRLDSTGTGTFAINYSVCDDGSIGSPGQAAFDSANNFIYVPDNAVKSTAVWRLTFNPATETISGAPEAMIPLADVRTLKPNGMALGPNPSGAGLSLYVTDLTEANIRRIDGPAGDPRLQTLTIIGTTGDLRGANGTVGFIGNRLYISENRAASWLDVTRCTDNGTTPCSTAATAASTAAGITGAIPLPSGAFIAGVTTDPVHNLVYAADSPGGAAATIWRYSPATNMASVVYLQGGTAPAPGATFTCATIGTPSATGVGCTRPTDGFATSTAFSFTFGLRVDPANGNLMITEDATAGARSGRGRGWVSPFIP